MTIEKNKKKETEFQFSTSIILIDWIDINIINIRMKKS